MDELSSRATVTTRQELRSESSKSWKAETYFAHITMCLEPALQPTVLAHIVTFEASSWSVKLFPSAQKLS